MRHCFSVITELNKSLREHGIYTSESMKESIMNVSVSVNICFEHGLCRGIAETTVEERRRLIAVRDSLSIVHTYIWFARHSLTLESKYDTSDWGSIFVCFFVIILFHNTCD